MATKRHEENRAGAAPHCVGGRRRGFRLRPAGVAGVLIPLLRWVLPAAGQGSRFAVQFFGTGTGQMDRIKIPLATAPAVNVGGDFTIEFWLRAKYADNAGTVAPGQNGDGWITGNIIVDRDVYGAGDYGDFGVALGRSAGRSVLAFGVHNGAWGETIVGTNHVGDNRWHHVAVVRRQATGRMQIVVDGRLDAEGNGPTGNVSYRLGRNTAWPDSDPYLVIGAEKHDAGSEYPSLAGWVDEVRIWTRALTVGELAEAAARILPPDEAVGLAAWFRLEEGSGQLVRDAVNGQVGTLIAGVPGNGAWTRWFDDGAAAPIQPYQPRLKIHISSPFSAVLSWFVPQHVEYGVESVSGPLSSTPLWSPLPGATPVAAANTYLSITVNTAAAETQFFRVSGRPSP